MDNLTMPESLSEHPVPALAPPSRAPERYEPVHPGSGRQGFGKRIASALAALGVLLAKAKTLIFLLPKLKLLTTFGSMVVSIAAYGLFFGLPFALGFVLLLFLHEIGHVIQLRREGIKASAPMFIPFLGAVISAKSMGRDAAAEARVGLAGPILGTVASIVPLVVWLLTGSDFWRALAYIGFVLNLFNLLPVVPLDGGRIVAALHPALWVLGFAGLVGLVFIAPNPILIIILVIAGLELWNRWRMRNHPQLQSYYRVTAPQRALVAALYFGLAALLVLGMEASHLPRDVLR
jgi:Zn-dependent protease